MHSAWVKSAVICYIALLMYDSFIADTEGPCIQCTASCSGSIGKKIRYMYMYLLHVLTKVGCSTYTVHELLFVRLLARPYTYSYRLPSRQQT